MNTFKRFRAVIITVLLAIFTNIAISYAADAFASKKSGSTALPIALGLTKSASSLLPGGPRPS